MDAEQELPYEKDNQLFVPGLKEPLERDGIRSIYIEVSGLNVTRAFENNEGKTSPRTYARGECYLENCSIGIAGDKEKTRSLSFFCHSCSPNEPDYEWNIRFGFISADWEIGTDDEWYVECQIPEAVFDEMVKAYKEGSANGLKIRCKSDMWADSFVRWAPIADKIDWKIPREKYGTASGQGKIESFSWEIVSKRPKEQEPAYKAGQALADEIFDNAGGPPPVPVQKPRSYTWLWVTGAVVLVFWFLAKSH